MKRRAIIVSLMFILVLQFFSAPAAAVYEKYAWEKLVTNQTSPDAADLQTELSNEISKMMAAGDTLEAAYMSVGIIGTFMMWGNPGEEIYTLSSALKYLPSSQQQTVKTYLSQKIRRFPPESVVMMRNGQSSPWGDQPLGGQRREYFVVDSSTRINIWPAIDVPLDSLYMIWTYADATGDWQYVSDRWSSIVSLYNSRSGTINRYGAIGGLIGMTRLADKMSQSPYNKSDAASLRSGALSKLETAMSSADFAQYAATARQLMPIASGGHDWSYPVFCYAHQSGVIGCQFAKEVGRYIKDYRFTSAKQSLEKYVNTPSTQAQAIFPAWNVYRSDYDYEEWRRGNYESRAGEYMGGENSYRTPDTPWTFFMAYSYIYEYDGPQMRKYLDVPNSIGDLYHMQRLVATLDRYSQNCWVDVRTGTQNCSPVPSGSAQPSNQPQPSPSASPNPADINGDGTVTSADIKLLLSSWLGTGSCATYNCDVMPNQKINSLDFGLLFKLFN